MLGQAAFQETAKPRPTVGDFEKLSTTGGDRLALKMSRGHASQTSMTEGLEAVQSRFAVTRWEKLLAANLLSSTRVFYHESKLYVEEQHYRPLQASPSRKPIR